LLFARQGRLVVVVVVTVRVVAAAAAAAAASCGRPCHGDDLGVCFLVKAHGPVRDDDDDKDNMNAEGKNANVEMKES